MVEEYFPFGFHETYLFKRDTILRSFFLVKNYQKFPPWNEPQLIEGMVKYETLLWQQRSCNLRWKGPVQSFFFF